MQLRYASRVLDTNESATRGGSSGIVGGRKPHDDSGTSQDLGPIIWSLSLCMATDSNVYAGYTTTNVLKSPAVPGLLYLKNSSCSPLSRAVFAANILPRTSQEAIL